MTMKTTDETQSLDFLVSKLKEEDTNYANIIKAIQIVYWIFIPFLVVMTLRKYLPDKNIEELIGGVCFVTAFLIIALGFRKYYKKYKWVDYSLPTAQMLRNAVWRYQPFQKNTIWLYVGILLMDVGLIFDWKDELSFWMIQIYFFGAITFGAIIGIIIWYVKYKPIRDEAKSLLREIES